MSTSPNHPPLTRPIHWFLDWDGTITQKDTLNALVNIAASSKPNFPTHSHWEKVVDAYMSDYTSTLNQLTPNGLPTTLEAERKLLQDLKIAEQRSLNRVYGSKIFADLTRNAISDGAQKALESGEVSLRPGFVDFYTSLSNPASGSDSENSTFHILSVNWSRHFIHSCLSASHIHLTQSSILANELDGIEEGEGRASSGEISPDGYLKIISSGDKVAHLRAIKENNGGGSVIYVGDSWPDIECLVEADVGICIRDEEMRSSQRKLAEALERLDIACPRLGDGSGKGMGNVCWAGDFVEIKRWADRI